MPGNFTLGKNERLKSRKQIELLFSKGRRFMLPPFRIFYSVDNDRPGPLQVGVGVGTRNFKRSVDRNRIKRLMREAWRLQKNELAGLLSQQKRQLNVFIIYTGKELPAYTEISNAMKATLEKIAQLIN